MMASRSTRQNRTGVLIPTGERTGGAMFIINFPSGASKLIPSPLVSGHWRHLIARSR
jgi:hypothetical protein